MEVTVGKNIVEITWNEKIADEVEKAEEKFREYIRQGWFAYIEMPDGVKRMIYDFNPSFQKIFFVHAITGG